MPLEEEFAGMTWNKRTFARVKDRVLNRYHKGYSFTMPNNPVAVYDAAKVKEIFSVAPEIKEDMIAKELRKTREYKKVRKERAYKRMKEGKKEKNRVDLTPMIGGLVMFAVGIGLAAGIGLAFSARNDDKYQIEKVYDKVLATYGDVNHDGIISNDEDINLRYEILKGHNVKYNRGENLVYARYTSGDRVSLEDMTKWIKDYNPEK